MLLVERYVRILAVLWTIIVAASLMWSIVRIKAETLEGAGIQAHISYVKDILYRQWNAWHGGVYVPVTEQTPPNPYLSDIAERDITTPSGRRLTLLNPAYMTRQVYGLMENAHGVRGHITSLKPIRPENRPDPWETQALRNIEQRKTATTSVVDLDGKTYYRRMYPFITEAPCLKCHAKQGYREGDVRGGLSVSIPMGPLLAMERRHIVTDGVTHGLLWLIGLAGINYGMQRIRRSEHERKTADEALRASEIKYRIVADNTYDFEFWLSPEDEFLYVSPSCEKITGYRREEFLADPGLLYRIIHPEDALVYERHRAEEEMKTEVVQFRIVRHGGDVRWIEHTCQPVFDNERKFLGIRGSNRDITDRRLAEDEIKHLAFFAAAIINSLPGIFYLIDRGGRLVRWNQNLETVSGYSAGELIHMGPLDLCAENERRLVSEKVEEVFTKGQSSMEAKLVSKDKKETPYFLRSERMLVDGREFIIGTGIDITERKQAEEALAKVTEELKRSNTDLLQFAYVASHDLQEPLRVISSCVQLLTKRYKGKMDEDADELIQYTVSGAKRMKELIRDVLDYLQIETGVGRFEPVELSQVIEKAIASLRETIDASGAIVTYQEAPVIVADFAQVLSLFRHLIENAIKFRGEEPPEIHISSERRENEWLFSVQDNGIGIDPEFTDKIFDVFKRLHTKEEYPGTGIGLAICKRIVERHGGRIWVESLPGRGSTFSFAIPDRK